MRAAVPQAEWNAAAHPGNAARSEVGVSGQSELAQAGARVAARSRNHHSRQQSDCRHGANFSEGLGEGNQCENREKQEGAKRGGKKDGQARGQSDDSEAARQARGLACG